MSKSSLADAGAEGGDHGPDLLVLEDLVEAGLLDVEDLAPERQDGLEAAVAALLGRAAGRVALDDEDLGQWPGRVLAVGELAGEATSTRARPCAGSAPGLAGGLAGPGGVDGLLDDLLGDRRVLLEVGRELLVDDGLDDALDLGVAELGLGLALELRVGELDERTAVRPSRVVAGECLAEVLEEVVAAGVGVDGAGQGGLEADEVGAALGRVDVVGEGEDRSRRRTRCTGGRSRRTTPSRSPSKMIGLGWIVSCSG